MSTSATPIETTTTRPRMWLVAGNHTPDPHPGHFPTVRDNLGHTWCPSDDGLMHMLPSGRHHARWHELRARYDLVEVA